MRIGQGGLSVDYYHNHPIMTQGAHVVIDRELWAVAAISNLNVDLSRCRPSLESFPPHRDMTGVNGAASPRLHNWP